MSAQTRCATRAGRAAFSLLEVVLALAILTGALTACLLLVDQGLQSAREARDRSRAQELCESVLGLITSGVLDIQSVQGEGQSLADLWAAAGLNYGTLDSDMDLQIEDDDWLCSIIGEPSDLSADLLKVTVIITERTPTASSTEFTMVRWMRDPGYLESLDQPTTEAP